jgi:hypothetical protein
VHERIAETDTSKLWRQYFGKYPEADWQPIARFLGVSKRSTPDLDWNITSWELTVFSSFDSVRFDENTKRDILEDYIGFLERRDPGGASAYVTRLSAFVSQHMGESVTNLPDGW